MEVRNGKTTVWVPREAFESVQRLWTPEFNWIPVPVDRSLPPTNIAYIQTNGPVSPLPPPPKPPRTPLSPLAPCVDGSDPLPQLTPLTTVAKAPRTPLGLPPLNTGSVPACPQQELDYFGKRTELETAITAGFSSGDSDRPSTPSTATEPASPSTPKDVASPGLSNPRIWRQSQQQHIDEAQASELPELDHELDPEPQLSQAREKTRRKDPGHTSVPSKMNEHAGDQWETVNHRPEHRPAHVGVNPASWKGLDGHRDTKMRNHRQTRKRDVARGNGSKKGFAVRLDMNLEMEVEIKGTINGDITLSAEALYAL